MSVTHKACVVTEIFGEQKIYKYCCNPVLRFQNKYKCICKCCWHTVESISTSAVQYIPGLCASASYKYGDKYGDSLASITTQCSSFPFF